MFIPDIKQKVGPHLLVASPFEVDAHQAADLIIMRARYMMVAARVRRHGFAERYPFDFTIRSHRASGAETELSKMLNGFGDWMFYGHAEKKAATIERWMLIDLNVWRCTLIRKGYKPSGWMELAIEKDNRDGTRFFSFDVRKFPKNILIAGNIFDKTQNAA